jgi:hypothetical protein
MITLRGLPGNLPSAASNDVFSQKVGDWAFASALPSTYKPVQDIPHSFAAQPVDSTVMDYLDGFVPTANIPVAHLYDHALQTLTDKVQDPQVASLLQHDCDLRAYFKARRIGDVYE